MQNLIRAGSAAAFGAFMLAATAGPATAAIVCNRQGVCWHAPRSYAYAPSYGVVVHPDNWRWGTGQRYVWREHPGRGYWRNGIWIRF